MQLPSGELDNLKDHMGGHGKESNLHISFPFCTDSILPFQNHCEYCEITCKIAPLQFAEECGHTKKIKEVRSVPVVVS